MYSYVNIPLSFHPKHRPAIIHLTLSLSLCSAASLYFSLHPLSLQLSLPPSHLPSLHPTFSILLHPYVSPFTSLLPSSFLVYHNSSAFHLSTPSFLSQTLICLSIPYTFLPPYIPYSLSASYSFAPIVHLPRHSLFSQTLPSRSFPSSHLPSLPSIFLPLLRISFPSTPSLHLPP